MSKSKAGTPRIAPAQLAAELQRLRKARGFTLRVVETETGISNAYLSQLETGKAESPSPPMLKKLADLYAASYEALMQAAGYLPTIRDLFLSHRSANKEFVRELAVDIESEAYQDRQLMTWLDEAEIRPGESIPGAVNRALEQTRFIGIVMTPEYFEAGSGWTDAEWHAALHQDPDNRKARILPLLAGDCPFVPYLLRHLRAIDLRANHYEHGLKELLAVLRNEPLPRPVTHRGQLITTGSRIDRSSLVAERAVPDADPDVVTERLFCNLLPIERLPKYVYSGGIEASLFKTRKSGKQAAPSKSRLKELIRAGQEENGVPADRRFMPAFRMFEERILTFHDLEDSDCPLASIVDENDTEVLDVPSLTRDEDSRNLLLSLCNMSLSRHLGRVGLTIDDEKQHRYFFPSKDGGANTISWTPRKNKAVRTVAKPVIKDGKILFWRHLGAYLRVIFLVNRFYIKITPTWVLTADGRRASVGPEVGRRVVKWTNPERNLQILFHVRFWTSVLRNRKAGPISIWTGDQTMEVATVPASIQQSYGIAGDERDLMKLLDEEAPLLAAEEEEQADSALENSTEDEELDEGPWEHEEMESSSEDESEEPDEAQ
jgi:HTH-type transcriptional regulator, competence development regulator